MIKPSHRSFVTLVALCFVAGQAHAQTTPSTSPPDAPPSEAFPAVAPEPEAAPAVESPPAAPETAPAVESPPSAPAPAPAPVFAPTPAPPASRAFFSDPYDPTRDYPSSTILGIYERGMIDGPRKGFVFRVAYGMSSLSGSFDGTDIDVGFVNPLEVTLALGGRIAIAPKLSITIEGEGGASLVSLVSVNGFDPEQAQRLDIYIDSSNGDPFGSQHEEGVGLPAMNLGPAASLTYALTPRWGLFVRPSYTWGVGLPILQNKNGVSGFMDGNLYTSRAFTLELGVLHFSMLRHLSLGVGYRSVTYAIEHLPSLGTSGLFFSIGSTS